MYYFYFRIKAGHYHPGKQCVKYYIKKKKKKPFYGNALAITNFYMYMHVLYIASW